MNAIGGYFELELLKKGEYHKKALRLNTGRNAFEYILKAKKYKKVYLPYFTCDVMLEPIKKLKLDYEFYTINENFIPNFYYQKIKVNEVFVYNNYFGICDPKVEEVVKKCRNIIIDNSQAFYSKPLKKIDTFYSPRKFFGLADGAYLYTDKFLDKILEQDESLSRMEHLLGRIEKGAEAYYEIFQENDRVLENKPIKKMSNLTHRLLSGIDYEEVKRKRIENFHYLHRKLKDSNQLNIDLNKDSVPMVYPYLIDNGRELKKKLIQNRIFVATYWPNVKDWAIEKSVELNLYNNLISLPIDQRYGEEEMNQIISLIK